MRRALAGLLIVALSGCAGAPAGGSLFTAQEDIVEFHAEGAFEAAVAAGADVARANEDLPGGGSASMPMASDDLDAAWGHGRYRLQSIHWWGPPGPPAPPPEPAHGEIQMVTMDGTAWNGFMVSPGHLQVVPGAMDRDLVRKLADDFLQNVTSLAEAGRRAAIEDLMADCDVLGCTTSSVNAVDGEGAWTGLGGWAAVTNHSLGPGNGRLEIGDWWFWFSFDTATLQDRSGEGSTTVTVGSNDVVRFEWVSRQPHGDDESYARMAEALEGTGIAPPGRDELAWTHQAAETE